MFNRCRRGFSAALLPLIFTISSAAHSAAPKNILIVYTFGAGASPYHVIASNFQNTLAREWQEPLDIYGTSLDTDRFTGPQAEAALVELLQKRYAGRHLDLIVPIGSPAAQFVVQHRERAFPGTPVLFVETDPRIISSEALRRNATVIRQDHRVTDIIEDILQMAPDTSNIVVVSGASPLEQFWLDVTRREYKVFNNRVSFTYFEGLSLDQIEKQVSALPPHAFIFLGLLIRDAAGITYDGYEPLRRLHAAANAPTYGNYQSQMGLGIIGGRLIQDETIGIQAARAAARILHGEPASDIPEQILPTASPVYDWRELKRWGISETRLPAGSQILFREPAFWVRYRWYVAGVILFFMIETAIVIGLQTNLVSRHRAEQSLRQSEERYRRLFEAESDALFLTDGETGRFLDANVAAEKMYGYSREELLRLTAGDISAEPDRTMSALAKGETHVSLRRHRRKDGTIFPVELSAGRLDIQGSRSYVVAIRNITGRLKAEEMLRQSEQKYRGLYESMMDAFVSVDMSGRIREFNLAYQQLLGYSEEELRRLTHMDVTPERWHAFEAQIVRDQVLPRGYSDVYEKEYRRKDGTVFPVELHTSLLRDEGGEPAGMSALVRDITERKHTEGALRASEERFRQVAETVSDFIWEIDADGLYRYASPSVARILGYTPDELIGKMHFYDLFAPDVREQLKTAAYEVFAARRSFQAFFNTNVSKTGRIVHLETSGMPMLDETGRLLGYRGADTDVTERHQAEMETQLLRRELALYSRAATVSELTASIAHELNQPLAAILSNAQAALSLMDRRTPDLKELREIFADIVADDQRAAEVIRSLRSMLKKGVTEHRPLSLNDLIRDVASIVRTEALARKVSVALDLDSSLPSVNGDRVQLQQVVLNLIVNAFEAMDASKQPRKLALRTRQAAGELVLDAVDSGPGIPPGSLDSIFQPFVTTKKEGLGMGLSLSRSIAMAHLGRLWAENNADGGATFHLALPLEDIHRLGITGDSHAISERVGRKPPGVRVLVVDDREAFRHAISSMLSCLPELKLIEEAADGAEAIQKISELKHDLILLDVGLPKINGIEVAGRIRTIAPNSKILFLTQYDSPDFVRAALKVGALGYILKVDVGSELLSAAAAVLRGDQYLSAGIRRRDQADTQGRLAGS